MISSWRVSNFKSIRLEEELPFAPLTVLCGANSSGKSALVQSILMVAQSLKLSGGDEPFVLNGPFVQLGEWEEVLHYGHARDPLKLSFALQLGDMRLHVSADAASAVVAGRDRHEARPTVISSVITREDSRERGSIVLGGSPNMQVTKKQIMNTGHEQLVEKRQLLSLVQPSASELASAHIEELVGVLLQRFLPDRLFMRVVVGTKELSAEVERLVYALRLVPERSYPPLTSMDMERELSAGAQAMFGLVANRLPRRSREAKGFPDQLLDAVEQIQHYTGTLTVGRCVEICRQRQLNAAQIGDLCRRLTGALPEALEKVASDRRGSWRPEEKELPLPYRAWTRSVTWVMGDKLYYLGPLREDPRVMYAMPPIPGQIDVGLKGEYTAAILDECASRKVACPVPPTGVHKKWDVKEMFLAEAVQLWLQRMGLADATSTSHTSKVGYRLTVKEAQSNRDMDLKSVGVGVSQVLPILVMTLLAPSGGIIVVEQPEVHLHPKVQSVLGDFFLGVAHTQKQCIVETHSEHMINRLRRRLAESEDPKLSDKMRIYFAERAGGVSKFRAIETNEYGAIVEWPVGFFDEAEEEADAILHAAFARQDHEVDRQRQSGQE